MAKISGSAGTVYSGTTTVFITAWTADVKGEIIDTTDSSVLTWKTFIANGWKEWSGTFEGFQETGVADLAIGVEAALVLGMVGAAGAATVKYAGQSIITGVSTNLSVVGTDAVKKSYTFQGTGTLTLTNP